MPAMADKKFLLAKAQFILDNFSRVREVADAAYEIRSCLIDLIVAGDISETDFYKIVSVLSPQSRSAIYQNYYIARNGREKIPANSDKGDFRDGDGQYAEYKASAQNQGDVLHIVQIRPWQKIDYYIVQKITGQRVFTFRLTKREMGKELKLCKAASAHGTKSAVAGNKNREFRMTIEPDSDNWKRWCKCYLMD